MVWTTPEFDYALRRPVNNTAIRAHDEIRDNSAVKHLAKLAKEHGLMFFFRSDCPYCHQNGTHTQTIRAALWYRDIASFTLDGKDRLDFPNPKANHGHAKALGLSVCQHCLSPVAKPKKLPQLDLA